MTDESESNSQDPSAAATEETSGDVNKEEENNSTMEGHGRTRSPKRWSQVLKSPSNVAAFSPSLDASQSSHGIGLQLAVDRSKLIRKLGIRTAAYLSEIATAHDQFGEIVVKTASVIHPDKLRFNPPLDEKSQTFYNAVLHLGSTSKSRAVYFRTRIVAPLRSHISVNQTLVESNGKKYNAARSHCLEARKRVIAARANYIAAIRLAEKSFRQWKKSRNQAETGAVEAKMKFSTEEIQSSHAWETALHSYGKRIPEQTRQLVQRIKDAETARLRYEELLQNENDAVLQAQKVETAALDSMQEVDTTCINYFSESVFKPWSTTDGGNIVPRSTTPQISTARSRTASLEELTPLDLKKGKDILVNMFGRPTNSYEEGMGVMDAETLGLPIESGQLRDNVKSQVAQIETQIKALQLLGEFLDKFTAGISTMESNLKDSTREQDSLQEAASSALGAKAGEIWKAMIANHEHEAKIASEWAKKLKELRVEKCDIPMEKIQKDLKYENDTDDNNWKTLCDAARTETKALGRVRQAKSLQEKARERVASVENVKSDDGTDETSPSNPLQKNRMGKALLAGSEAVKKFQENTRMAMAKSNFVEAKQSAAKEQLALDDSAAAKSQGITNYKRVTEIRVGKLASMLQERKNDIDLILTACADALGKLNTFQCLAQVPDEIKKAFESLMDSVDTWVEVSADRIRKSAEKVQNQGENDVGNGLPPKPEGSSTIEKLLSMTIATNPPPTFLLEIEDTDSIEDELCTDPVAESVNEGVTSINRNVSPPPIYSTTEQQIKRSTTTPDLSESSLKHSMFRHSESNPAAPNYADSTPQMKEFIEQFWSDRDDLEPIPNILKIVTCAYRPKEKAGFLIPNLHGRLYTTVDTLYFLALDGKNFILPLSDVISVANEKGFMGGNDRALAVTYKSTENEASFVLSRLESRDSLLAHLRGLLEALAPVTTSGTSKAMNGEKELANDPVPPDAVMQRMSIVVSKPLRNVSIRTVYEKVWSEGDRTSEKPFYGPWLEKEECFDINVGEWEYAEPSSEGFLNPWCKERYSQRRVVTFQFKRTTHLYIGPPIAGVKQIQYCSVDGNDKCIVSTSATFDGIPYADAFAVEMRWVARRQGSNDIQVEVGLDVDFKKTTMLKSQIKSGTIAETTNVHRRMFDAVKAVCAAPGQPTEDIEEQTDATENEIPAKSAGLLATIRSTLSDFPVDRNFLVLACGVVCYPIIWNIFAYLLGAPAISVNEAHRIQGQIRELQEEVRALKSSLDVMVALLKEKQ